MASYIEEIQAAAKMAANAVRQGPELMSKTDKFRLNTKSIARGAKDSTFQFPCLIVDSTPIDMANTVARTLDQVYATFTQTWLSMNSMFDITIDPTPLSYLRKMHQNLKVESGSEDLFVPQDEIPNYMEKVYDGSYRLYMNPERNFGVVFNKAAITSDVIESHRDELRGYMSDFNLEPIETFVSEAESDRTNELDFISSMIKNASTDNRLQNDLRRAEISGKHSRAPKLLSTKDIKKSNDMLPYGIEVRLIAVNDKKEFVQYVDFVVGVKTVLHPVSSADMIENITRAFKNRSLLFKFIRWTTGEISLVKDILLNIDDMKDDALNKQNGKSPFFSTLKRLKKKKIGLRNLTVPHAVIPNATLVITAYEADYLERNYAINVRKESVAKKLIETMFLMSFIVLDEATNSISVLYDGDDAYQTYSMETLERDNDLNSNKLGREIGRMIAR